MTEPDPQSAAKPKRRWHQYSLRTLLLLPLLLALVLSAVYTWPYVHRRYIVWRLQDYVDKDLQTLSKAEKERVDGWIEALLGEESKWGWDPINPVSNLRLHAVDDPRIGRQLYVVTMKRTERLYVICILHTLDSAGRLIRSVDFPIGFGTNPSSVAFNEMQGFQFLIVETPTKAGKTREYYQVADERVELLRSENDQGKCEMGRTYYSPYSPVERSDWQNRLDSSDRIEQLRASCVLHYPGVDKADRRKRP
jgi:hypothetical protein